MTRSMSNDRTRSPRNSPEQLSALPRHEVAAAPRRQRVLVVGQRPEPVIANEFGLAAVRVVLQPQERGGKRAVERRVGSRQDH